MDFLSTQSKSECGKLFVRKCLLLYPAFDHHGVLLLIVKNKLTLVCYTYDLLLLIYFVITLSKFVLTML